MIQNHHAIMRCSKLKSPGEVAKAIGHASRTREVWNADPSVPNQVLVAGGFEDYQARLPATVRTNAVHGLDVLMGTTPGFFDREGSARDPERLEAWKTRSMAWLREEFGAANIIRADLHLDETTPHIQAIVMPIKDGKLNAKHWIDGRQKLSAMQDRYHEAVKDLGLYRGLKGSKARHTEVKQFYEALKGPERLPEVKKGKFLAEAAEDYLKRAEPALETLKAKAAKATLLERENAELKRQLQGLLRPKRVLSQAQDKARTRTQEKEQYRGR